ncbi:MAG: ABC transporter ATP-binding protein [Chitinophagales bacterium]
MLVEAVDLRKTYRRGTEEVHALDGLSLSIAEGEFLAILGPSGSGKSTFLNLLGLLDEPTAGRLALAGRPVEALRPPERQILRRELIGFVFQQFLLVPAMTALQNVMLPLYFAGRRDAAGRARAMLERVGLGGRLDHLPAQLSGGEIQRVAVARALVGEPRLLLADEPTGNLDTRTAEEVTALLREINQAGTTVVVVTHNLDLAKNLPRTITMRDGRMISDVKGEAGVA